MSRIFALALLLPAPAFAHTGDHSAAGPLHLLTEPDHIAFAALAVVGAVIFFRLWVRK